MAGTIHTYDNWSLLGKGPRTMRYPSLIGEKRPIDVRISSWVGVSIGAKHIYVEVTEGINQFWSESEDAWVEISVASECTGYHLKADVFTEKEARQVAEMFITMIGGKDLARHEVHWHGRGRPKKYPSGY